MVEPAGEVYASGLIALPPSFHRLAAPAADSGHLRGGEAGYGNRARYN
jgi:hypothetical protein